MPDRRMGSQTTVSLDEAVVILGMSRVQVERLVSDGIIRVQGRSRHGKPPRLIKEDVDPLVGLRQRDKGAALAMQALALSRRLERELAEVKEALCLDLPSLSVDREDVIHFYAYAEELVFNGAMRVEEMAPLMKKLMAIDEYYLGLIEEFVEESEPWDVFLKLANRLHAGAVVEKDRMQAQMARMHLRNLAFVYAKARHRKGGKKYDFRFGEEGLAERLLKVVLNPDPLGSIRSQSAPRTGPTPSSGSRCRADDGSA